jgi:carboxylesterase
MTDPVIKAIKKVKSVLFADPKLLYKEERHLINQPFYFEGNNNKAVLLIHGWTSVPYEVRRLGKYLNENGYTVSGPMLSGHGTVPKDLEDVKWTDWLKDAANEYLKLKEKNEKVYIAGTSIGGNLAVMLASKYPEVSGLILMATPYKIRLENSSLLFAKILRLFKKYSKKFYPPTFGVATTITRIISYQTYPVASALETFDLIKVSRKYFSKIIQPCFLIQSASDHITARGNLEIIYAIIGSKIKKKKYIKRAYHTFISDVKNENVFQDILNFLEEN